MVTFSSAKRQFCTPQLVLGPMDPILQTKIRVLLERNWVLILMPYISMFKSFWDHTSLIWYQFPSPLDVFLDFFRLIRLTIKILLRVTPTMTFQNSHVDITLVVYLSGERLLGFMSASSPPPRFLLLFLRLLVASSTATICPVFPASKNVRRDCCRMLPVSIIFANSCINTGWNSSGHSQLHILTVGNLLTFFLTFFLAYLLTFFLASLLTFFLTVFPAHLLTFFLTFARSGKEH